MTHPEKTTREVLEQALADMEFMRTTADHAWDDADYERVNKSTEDFREALAHLTPTTTVEVHPNPTHVWAAISKTQLLLFANEKDARAMQPTATSAFDIQRHPVYGTPPQVEPHPDEFLCPFCFDGKQAYTPQASEPAPNPWKDAVLDQLASHAMDAPTDMPPADILKRVIDMAVTMATDPAISDPAPSTAEEAVAEPQYRIVVNALSNLLAQVEKFCAENGEADFYTGEALKALESVCTYEHAQRAALLQSTADHIAEKRKLVAAMPVVQLTHPTADMQIAGGAIELDYTGVQTAPNTVGWLTAARVWLAMERASTQPKRLTFEALNAVREAHQNKRTDDYFEARPQIDNTDRRRVFENGYKRGFDDGMVFQRDQGAA